MAQNIPITVILKNQRQKALVEEVAHRLDMSRSEFCRNAILREAVAVAERIKQERENQEESAG